MEKSDTSETRQKQANEEYHIRTLSLSTQDLGIDHIRIKPRTPRLNGKVERSHLIDDHEFYQILEFKDDMDLAKKITLWENFYNFQRPHGAHEGKTPYEALREKLASA